MFWVNIEITCFWRKRYADFPLQAIVRAEWWRENSPVSSFCVKQKHVFPPTLWSAHCAICKTWRNQSGLLQHSSSPFFMMLFESSSVCIHQKSGFTTCPQEDSMNGEKIEDGSMQQIFVLMIFHLGLQAYGVPNSNTTKWKPRTMFFTDTETDLSIHNMWLRWLSLLLILK